LAQNRELLGDTNGNCAQREGARDGANLSSYTVRDRSGVRAAGL